MDDQNQVSQRFVVIWALVFPALIKKLIKFVPFLKLEYSFKLQFNNLKMFRSDIGLSGFGEFVYHL